MINNNINIGFSFPSFLSKDDMKIKLLKFKLLFKDSASITMDDTIDGVTEKFIVTVTKHEWEHDIPKPDWNAYNSEEESADAFDKFQRDVVDNYVNSSFIANYSYAVSHVSEPEEYFFEDYHDIWDVEGAVHLAWQDLGLWSGWKHNQERESNNEK
tara:strand:- start:11 stop:478 length:468 start_codon:yes stop_codon:yes gene_type:complete